MRSVSFVVYIPRGHPQKSTVIAQRAPFFLHSSVLNFMILPDGTYLELPRYHIST